MVLKKNERQISFLHIYHHATTFFPCWCVWQKPTLTPEVKLKTVPDHGAVEEMQCLRGHLTWKWGVGGLQSFTGVELMSCRAGGQ